MSRLTTLLLLAATAASLALSSAGPRSVVVTGAGGQTGQHLFRRLLALPDEFRPLGLVRSEESRAARGLAWFCVALATLALSSVFCRTTWQNIKCLRGLDAWDDALLFKAHAEDRRSRGDDA